MNLKQNLKRQNKILEYIIKIYNVKPGVCQESCHVFQNIFIMGCVPILIYPSSGIKGEGVD